MADCILCHLPATRPMPELVKNCVELVVCDAHEAFPLGVFGPVLVGPVPPPEVSLACSCPTFLDEGAIRRLGAGEAPHLVGCAAVDS